MDPYVVLKKVLQVNKKYFFLVNAGYKYFIISFSGLPAAGSLPANEQDGEQGEEAAAEVFLAQAAAAATAGVVLARPQGPEGSPSPGIAEYQLLPAAGA